MRGTPRYALETKSKADTMLDPTSNYKYGTTTEHNRNPPTVPITPPERSGLPPTKDFLTVLLHGFGDGPGWLR